MICIMVATSHLILRKQSFHPFGGTVLTCPCFGHAESRKAPLLSAGSPLPSLAKQKLSVSKSFCFIRVQILFRPETDTLMGSKPKTLSSGSDAPPYRHWPELPGVPHSVHHFTGTPLPARMGPTVEFVYKHLLFEALTRAGHAKKL